jgi:leucyl aminopeptidase
MKRPMQPPLSAAPANAIPIHALRTEEWASWLAERALQIAQTAALYDFRAQAGKSLVVQASDGAIDRVILGLGDKPNAMLFGALGKELPAGDYRIDYLPGALSLSQAAIGFALGAYAFTHFKERKKAAPRLIGLDAAFATADRIARAVYLARDLINLPANVMGPEGLHAQAEALAERIGAKFSAIVGEALLDQKYKLIHAVGRAAKEPPRLLHIHWGQANAPRLALVGKGVTFDSGGLDIKPDSAMRLMKKDMGGAANVLGLMQAIAEANLPIQVDVWIPAVENAIGADAFRPGDVLISRKGLSVEIDNTDAEGRLILADALTRAGEDNPDLVFDFATLTGAARIALGQDLTPLFTDDEALAAEFADASRETGDMVWRLPLWDGYEAEMDCQAADLKNAGDTGQAGAILGGLFLRRFAPKSAWAHLDCYCWTLRERPGRPVGADAQGLRAALAVVEKRFKPS